MRDHPRVPRFKLAFAVAKYFEFGGMQRTFLRLACECARRGHEVHVFAAKWAGDVPDDVQLHLLAVGALTNHTINRKFGAKLREVTRGSGFDCITGFTKLPHLDVYYVGESCYAARTDARRGRLYRFLPRYRCLKALEEAVFAADKDTEILLIAPKEGEHCMHYYGTNPQRLHVLPPGINKERLIADIPTAEDRLDLRRQLAITNEDYMVLNVGSRFRTKGVDRAITAIAALPDSLRKQTKLVVVGDDSPRPFNKIAGTLGIADRVIFAGAREDIAKFYYTADLLVHPSYMESAGATILEAMICGLPVLATENCGLAFHVECARAGLVCPVPFKQQTLNKMLVEMLTSSQRAEWSKNALAYAEDTDLYSLIERAADIILARAGKNQARQ